MAQQLAVSLAGVLLPFLLLLLHQVVVSNRPTFGVVLDALLAVIARAVMSGGAERVQQEVGSAAERRRNLYGVRTGSQRTVWKNAYSVASLLSLRTLLTSWTIRDRARTHPRRIEASRRHILVDRKKLNATDADRSRKRRGAFAPSRAIDQRNAC